MRALAAALALALAGGDASADQPRPDPVELQQVRDLEQKLEYERALVLADQVIARGGLDHLALALLHFEAGKLAAGLDHPDAAQDHFARALALVPSLELPAGTSPKITTPFDSARAQPHELHVDYHRQEGQVTVTADPDPLHLVASVQIRVLDASGQGEELTTRDGPPFTIRLPAQAKELEVRAFDEHGNQLYLSKDFGDGLRETPGAWQLGHPHHGPWYRSVKVLAAAGIGSIAAFGGFSAWREHVAQDEWNQLNNDPMAHDYSQLRAVEDRGRSWALAANISFGVAGALTLIGALAWVSSHSGPPTGSPVIAITAGPGTVGVAGRF